MDKDAVLHVVDLPFAQAVMLENWDAPRGRFFVDYRVRHGHTAVLGNGVIDEFRTISGPILIAPAAIIGGVYDTGMRLADARDVEAPIDQGWPPLTLGMEVAPPPLARDWKQQMLDAMQGRTSGARNALWRSRVQSTHADGVSLSVLKCSHGGQPAVTVIATDATLLPQQLGRLADRDRAGCTVAVATGNRLPYVEAGELHEVEAVSERRLAALVRQLGRLLRE